MLGWLEAEEVAGALLKPAEGRDMGPEATKGPPVFLNRLAYVGFSLLLKKRKEILFSIVIVNNRKVPISDFQSQFSMSKIIRIFQKKFIEEYQFRGMFFATDIFWKLQILKHFIY